MFDFIPLPSYTPIYYYVLLSVVPITFLHTQYKSIFSVSNKLFNEGMGVFVLLFVIIYMGLRPVDPVFVDMTGYARTFENYAMGMDITTNKDLLYHIFTKTVSYVISTETYFLLLAFIYVFPLYLICKKWFKHLWFYGFFLLIVSFEFWAYGTNGIRNGLATTFFLLGLSRDKRIWQIIWIVVAIGFHKTMLLPALGFAMANIYNRPKKMILFWVLTIPLSLIGGGIFETFFSTIGFGDDDRLAQYLTTEASKDSFSNVGFRWDFLLYGATAVFAGWYYIFKLKYSDKIYFWLFNTYVFTNAFWILVIRANFSNRFAYLSWFMMALVIIYPLLKEKLITSQHKKIGIIIVFYFAFTFVMKIVLK